MTREKNYERGARAEERIRSYIQRWAAVTAESTSQRYPDLSMKIGDQFYAIECKSLAATNNGNGGRKGNVIISSLEIMGMNALSDHETIPILAVEIRPPSGSSSYSYFIISWDEVMKEYSKRRPNTLTRSFYWILQNGEHLGWWLVKKVQEACFK